MVEPRSNAREQWRRPLAPALALVLLAAAVVELPRAVQDAAARSERAGGMTRAERELAPARAVDLEPALVLRAAALVPEEASYHVVVGDGFEPAHPATLEAVEPFAAYWLLPRRRVEDAASAEWILSFGVPPDRLPAGAQVVEEPVPGQWLVQVRR